MLSTKQLAIGALAFASSSALAVFDLDLTTQATKQYALEGLDTQSPVTVGTTTVYDVDSNSTDLDVVGSYGVGVINGAQTYVRYDLTNGVFGAAPTATISASPGMPGTIITGGTVGASSVVFQFTATQAIGATIDVTMASARYAALDTSSGIGITRKIFETATAAQTNGTPLATKSAASGADMITFVSGVSSTITPATTGNVASVAAGFATFTGAAPRLAIIGSATVTSSSTATSVVNFQDGTELLPDLSEIIDTTLSTFVVTGDSFGITTQTFGLNNGADCSGTPTALVANAAGTASVATPLTSLLAPLSVKQACMTIATTNGTTQIPKGNHTIAITFAPLDATIVNTPAAVTGTLGTIAHDGTTVELPYLTTFSDYNQRVVMTNRGTTAASYTVTPFQTETGVTAAAGTGAAGSIPAGGVAVVKTSDIVTLTGGTRAAATLNIIASDGNVNVATTQVNLSDGSTDTVINN